MNEPWIRGLLIGALVLIGYGCTPENGPACETDDDCTGAGEVCSGGACAAAPCDDGDIRACLVGNGVGCVGAQRCEDGRFLACEAPAEICDGIDNDCNGRIDEGYAELGEECKAGEGECLDYGRIVCTADGAATECSATPGDGGDEVCDGFDNDCDGATDEELGGGACATDLLGACAAGTEACTDGDTVCVPDTAPTDEVCDGIDDDCDGHVDEARNGGPLAEPCYDGPEGSEGVGPCAAGVRVCTDGAFGACAEQVLPADEICDLTDNDCNGEVDDRDAECVCAAETKRVCYSGPEGTAGIGACATGIQVCADDGSAWGPCEDETGPGIELCDGKDNDCNGVVDDAFGVGEICDTGIGACAAQAVRICDRELGQVVCPAEPGLPADELCNGIDDDCNGRVDDVDGVGAACLAGLGACAEAGVLACDFDGEVSCTARPGNPTDEVCNDIDDDCDGVIDDVDGLGDACEVGTGLCTSAGVLVCGEDALECGAVPNPPQREICGNGLDENCDGEIDDDLLCGDCGNGQRDRGEQCDDGNRDDGDGCDNACRVEEGFECFDGPEDTPVGIESRLCDVWTPVDAPAWIGGYGVAYESGAVQFAGGAQRFWAGYAVLTTAEEGQQAELIVGANDNGRPREANTPAGAERLAVGNFDRLPTGAYSVQFPDINCGDNQGVVNVDFRTLDACRPLVCEADADCLFADEACAEGTCVDVICGDGQRQGNEECDDGNSEGGDGCDAQCQVEPGFECFDGPEDTPVTIQSRLCDWAPVDAPAWIGGYGVAYESGAVQFAGGAQRFWAGYSVLTTTEDGQEVELAVGVQDNGRPREANTAAEAERLAVGNFDRLPSGAYGVRFPDINCGDNQGVINLDFRTLDLCIRGCEGDDDCPAGEICVDGGCALPDAVCGDGQREGDEGCDDGNTDGGDGCDAQCQVEPGFECDDAPDETPGDICYRVCGCPPGEICIDGGCALPDPFCGDGEVGDDEECDDGNGEAGDGCSAACVVEPGLTCQDFSFAFGARDTFPVPGHQAPQWNISEDGRAIAEVINSWPAHYASDLPISPDYVSRFEIDINSDQDDDNFGWTIGGGPTALTAPDQPYLLFSWRGGDAVDPELGEALAGLRVDRVVGAPSGTDLAFSNGPVELLSRATTLGRTPWVHRQTYTVEIIGDSERLRVYVDGELEFDLRDVPLGDGHLGLYTNSQPGFRARLISPESIQVCSGPDPICGDGEIDPGEGCDDGGAVDGDGCSAACVVEPDFECQDLSFAFGASDTFPIPGHIAPQWIASPDGRTVTETANSWPAHYGTDLPISPDYVSRFEVTVASDQDDDNIGWAIGGGPTALSAPDQPYLLFSWAGSPSVHPELGEIPAGLRVSRVIGAPSGNDLAYSTGPVELITRASTLGVTPWVQRQTYTVEIIGDADRLRVYVDGELEFDLSDVPLGDGNLGLFTFSQPGFQARLISPESIQVCAVPEPFCGDGEVDDGEVCDDGNGEDGDGCSAACTPEPGFACEDFSFRFGGPDTIAVPESPAPRWGVSADGRAIQQNVNSAPTHYSTDLPISPDYVTRFEVLVRVEEDDDVVGWTIGGGRTALTAPTEPYLLFSWKAGDQDTPPFGFARVGLRAAEVVAPPTFDDLWQVDDGTVQEIGPAATLGDAPWVHLQRYTVEMIGNSDRLRVYIDGSLEFDLRDVPFGDGTLGIFTYSQPAFRAELVEPVTLQLCRPTEICDNDVDDNEDGAVDCDDVGCAANPACVEAAEICDSAFDEDRDGAIGCDDPDCADDPACAAAPEICDSGVDDDGDGAIDCEDPDCAGAPNCQGACPRQDAFEPNDDRDGATPITPGTYPGLAACDEVDAFTFDVCPQGLYGIEAVVSEGTMTYDLYLNDIENPILTDQANRRQTGTGGGAGVQVTIVYTGAGAVYDLDLTVECGEVCDNQIDDDGDGAVDCDDPDCADDAACAVVGAEICDSGVDEDGDGAIDCADPDCAEDPVCDVPAPCLDDDRFEPNDTFDAPVLLEPGSHPDLFWCGEADPGDWYAVDLCAGGRLTVTAAHARDAGNVELNLSRPVAFDEPELLVVSTTGTEDEVIEYFNTGEAFQALLNVYGEANTYGLDVAIDGCGEVREVCGSGGDEDGDGLTDCADPDCARTPTCVCQAPDPFEDDALYPTLLVPGDRVTNQPGCQATDVHDQVGVYGCGELIFVGDFEFSVWVPEHDATIQQADRFVSDNAGARLDFENIEAALVDWFVPVPDGCEPGEIPAPLIPPGQSLRVAGVLTDADPTVNANCDGPAEVQYQIVRITNPEGVERVVDISASFRDAPGSIAVFDEPFAGPELLDECLADPAQGFQGVVMAPGETLSVVVFNTGADVASNQFVLRAAIAGGEICDNGGDDDGDGAVDCDDPDCAVAPGCVVAGAEICNSGFDDNGDGNVDCNDPQCAADPLCVDPIACPGDDRYGLVDIDFNAPQLGSGRFERLITCEGLDIFTTRICPGGLLTVEATGEQALSLSVIPANPNVLPRVGQSADAQETARVGVVNDDPVDRRVQIVVNDFDVGAQGDTPLRYALDIRIEGCAPLSRFEVCENGVDDDGNGAVDCDDPACAAAESCIDEICDSGVDEDGDDWIGCNDPECRGHPACTLADQVYFSVPGGELGEPAMSPTAIYSLNAAGTPTMVGSIDSPNGDFNGIQALAHDGQVLWGFIQTALPDGRQGTIAGPIDLGAGTLTPGPAFPGREIVGAAFNGLGELWMLDRLSGELIVAIDLAVIPARSIPVPMPFMEGDIAFLSSDTTQFALTAGPGEEMFMFRGDTAAGLIEPAQAGGGPLEPGVGSALAYGRRVNSCAPGLYTVESQLGYFGTLDIATNGSPILEFVPDLPDVRGSMWMDGASAPRVLIDRAVPGCGGIFETCAAPDGDGDGLNRCEDPDCVNADPFCAE